jgi:hypothetical protein
MSGGRGGCWPEAAIAARRPQRTRAIIVIEAILKPFLRRSSDLIRHGNQTLTHGDGCGFRPIRNFQFLNDAVHVIARRVITDSEGTADFFIRKALGNELQHLKLSRGQIRPGHSLRETGSDVGRKVTPFGIYHLDRLE